MAEGKRICKEWWCNGDILRRGMRAGEGGIVGD
jgi:hypothetical protein